MSSFLCVEKMILAYLHVMHYTLLSLRTWEQELIAIFECFPLDKFYILEDKLLLAKNTKNKNKQKDQ